MFSVTESIANESSRFDEWLNISLMCTWVIQGAVYWDIQRPSWYVANFTYFDHGKFAPYQGQSTIYIAIHSFIRLGENNCINTKTNISVFILNAHYTVIFVRTGNKKIISQ